MAVTYVMDDIKLAQLGNKEAAKRLTDAGVLLECPFCGGKAMMEYDTIEPFEYTVFCGDCGVMPTTNEDEQVALSALRPVSRELVEKVWRGEWKHYLPPLGAGNIQCRCTKCGRTPDVETPFCAWCGAPMTGEAVDILLKRLEELHGRS